MPSCVFKSSCLSCVCRPGCVFEWLCRFGDVNHWPGRSTGGNWASSSSRPLPPLPDQRGRDEPQGGLGAAMASGSGEGGWRSRTRGFRWSLGTWGWSQASGLKCFIWKARGLGWRSRLTGYKGPPMRGFPKGNESCPRLSDDRWRSGCMSNRGSNSRYYKSMAASSSQRLGLGGRAFRRLRSNYSSRSSTSRGFGWRSHSRRLRCHQGTPGHGTSNQTALW